MTENVAHCGSCGQPMGASNAFCVHCGAAAQTESQSPGYAAGAQPRTPPPPPPGQAQPSAQMPPPPPPQMPPPHTQPSPQSQQSQHAGSQYQLQNFVMGEHSASLTQRSLLTSLFDTTFTSLAGTKIVRLLYVLSMILIGLIALFFVIAAFRQSSGLGIVVLFVVAPIFSLFWLIYARLLLELYISVFQIMANSNELVAQGRRR